MAPTTARETLQHAFPNNQGPLLSYNLPFPSACRQHIDSSLSPSRVYIICSGSLARNTSSLQRLEGSLGSAVVGIRRGMKPHVLMSEVLEVIEDARRMEANVIVTLGGGSLIDGAKAIAFVSRYRRHASRPAHMSGRSCLIKTHGRP